MVQQGQVFQLASRNGEARWAYRYPLHGRQPDGDRPPLRPPRPRRTRARNHAPRRPQFPEANSTSTPWTPGGRRRSTPPPPPATETASKQELTASPLTDSNRRPLPYQREAREARELAGTKAPQEEGNGRRRVTARGRARPRWCSLTVPSRTGAPPAPVGVQSRPVSCDRSTGGRL